MDANAASEGEDWEFIATNASTPEDDAMDAQRAVDECLALVESHLGTYLEENQERSFEDWIAALHPVDQHARYDACDPTTRTPTQP